MSTTLTWYGHAALGLETSGYKILIDPFFSENPAASASAKGPAMLRARTNPSRAWSICSVD